MSKQGIHVEEITIKKFDPSKMKQHAVILFIGKRNTGKSFLIKDILYHQKDRFPVGKVISATNHLNHFYDTFIPPMLIHEEYTENILSKIYERQSIAIKDNWSNPNCFVIFDDCLSDKSWQKDPLIRKLFYEGRHSKLTFLLGIQSPNELPVNFRNNIDYVFILRNNIINDRDRLHKNYAGMMRYDLFEQLMNTFTQDYGALVIDNTTRSNEIEDQVFFYKASDHPGFRICSEKVWQDSRNYIEHNKQEYEQPNYNKNRKTVYQIKQKN
jgi:hypothetical protein